MLPSTSWGLALVVPCPRCPPPRSVREASCRGPPFLPSFFKIDSVQVVDMLFSPLAAERGEASRADAEAEDDYAVLGCYEGLGGPPEGR